MTCHKGWDVTGSKNKAYCTNFLLCVGHGLQWSKGFPFVVSLEKGRMFKVRHAFLGHTGRVKAKLENHLV